MIKRSHKNKSWALPVPERTSQPMYLVPYDGQKRLFKQEVRRILRVLGISSAGRSSENGLGINHSLCFMRYVPKAGGVLVGIRVDASQKILSRDFAPEDPAGLRGQVVGQARVTSYHELGLGWTLTRKRRPFRPGPLGEAWPNNSAGRRHVDQQFGVFGGMPSNLTRRSAGWDQQTKQGRSWSHYHTITTAEPHFPLRRRMSASIGHGPSKEQDEQVRKKTTHHILPKPTIFVCRILGIACLAWGTDLANLFRSSRDAPVHGSTRPDAHAQMLRK